MTSATTNDGTAARTSTSSAPTDIREFGQELWAYLTGKGATIEYELSDMTVEVPKTTGAESPRATWKVSGTLRIRTSDHENAGSLGRQA